MTLEQLQARIRFQWVGYGTYKVTMTYNGKTLSATTHDTLAIDRINTDDCTPPRQVVGHYTLKGAYQALYNQIKSNNDL